jgi:hypothetical protein
MAQLRFSRPGMVGSQLVDLGPSVGRTTFTRGTIHYGGAYVQGMTGKQATKLRDKPMHLRPSRAVVRPAKPLCGRVLHRDGRTCARDPDHKRECKSRAAMDRINERQRLMFRPEADR